MNWLARLLSRRGDGAAPARRKSRKPAAHALHEVRYATSPLLASKTPPWRSKFLVACIGLSFCVLLGRAVYVQIIVKACPQAETPLEPINQGKSYDEEKSMSLEERKASLTAQGCVDVPIPMEWITGNMTPEACRSHAGYLAAMEFLQQRQDLAGLQAVGAWECMVTEHQVVGAINQ